MISLCFPSPPFLVLSHSVPNNLTFTIQFVMYIMRHSVCSRFCLNCPLPLSVDELKMTVLATSPIRGSAPHSAPQPMRRFSSFHCHAFPAQQHRAPTRCYSAEKPVRRYTQGREPGRRLAAGSGLSSRRCVWWILGFYIFLLYSPCYSNT